MKKKITLLALLLIMAGTAAIKAQMKVGPPGGTPDASAMLDVQGTDATTGNIQGTFRKGLLLPRLSTSQRNTSITAPKEGLQIYNTTTGLIEYYNGTAWVSMAGVAANPSSGGVAVFSSITTGGSTSGTLTAGQAASGVTKIITATVTTAGSYSITAVANGVAYYCAGTATAGTYNITLTASGTPTTAGSTTFNLSTSPSYSFSVPVN